MMSRLRFTASRLLRGVLPHREGLARRLERERPRPDARFARRTGVALSRQARLRDRPPYVRAQALALIVAGAVVLAAALVVALG